MKRLNQSPTFVILCVLCLQGQSFFNLRTWPSLTEKTCEDKSIPSSSVMLLATFETSVGICDDAPSNAHSSYNLSTIQNCSRHHFKNIAGILHEISMIHNAFFSQKRLKPKLFLLVLLKQVFWGFVRVIRVTTKWAYKVMVTIKTTLRQFCMQK